MFIVVNFGEFKFVYEFIEWWREIIWLSIGGGLLFAVLVAGVVATGGKESKFGAQFEIRSQGFEFIMLDSEIVDPAGPPFYRWKEVKRIEYTQSIEQLNMTISDDTKRPEVLLTVFPDQISEFKRFKELEDAWSTPVFVLIQRWQEAMARGETDGSGVLLAEDIAPAVR
jgi:hypothetical protein